MSCLFADGGEMQEGTLLYDVFTLAAYSTTTRFGYGYSISMNNAVSEARKKFAASSAIYCGFAAKIPASGVMIFDLYGDNGATVHLGLSIKSDGAIELRRGAAISTGAAAGGTVIATSAAGLVALNTNVYLEVYATISDTVGVCQVRLNGNTTPVINFSGDTKNAGTNNTIDQISWNVGSNATVGYLDDIYINDGNGSVNNGFLGDVRVQTLVPTGAGASTGLTPSTGSNWQTVDEAPPSATDYSGSPTSGTRDTYAITDLLAGSGVVKAVRHTTAWHKSDAGVMSMKHITRIGGTNYSGSTVALAASMTLHSDMHDVSPATSAAWTVSEVNGTEIGAEVV